MLVMSVRSRIHFYANRSHWLALASSKCAVLSDIAVILHVLLLRSIASPYSMADQWDLPAIGKQAAETFHSYLPSMPGPLGLAKLGGGAFVAVGAAL